jgi:hypothetical protein
MDHYLGGFQFRSNHPPDEESDVRPLDRAALSTAARAASNKSGVEVGSIYRADATRLLLGDELQ